MDIVQEAENYTEHKSVKGKLAVTFIVTRFIAFIILAIAVPCIINENLWFCRVRGHSMEPTLCENSLGVVLKHGYSLQRGDFAVLRLNSGELLVKRVIGLPGDHVVIDTDVTIVNDDVIDESYVFYQDEEYNNVDVTVGDDQYFLLGDNRNNSLDSRYFGAVDSDQLIGEYFALTPLLD